jgi:hypothetical protein
LARASASAKLSALTTTASPSLRGSILRTSWPSSTRVKPKSLSPAQNSVICAL